MLAVDIAEPHLQMLKNPRYGYGSQMNPCIDCHGLMLREAGKIMEREGADFLFTGEVLGQRPMSQRRDSMRSVEKLSGYSGRILRPLSAKLLDPTLAEQAGLVDRNRLLDIQGRSRKRQAELAARLGIVDYPQPGGGCMLTGEGFANRLRNLFDGYPEASAGDVEVIKYGRAFLLPGKNICMVGRQQGDNEKMERIARDEDICLRTITHPGPTCIILAPSDPLGCLEMAAGLAAAYCDAPENTPVRVQWRHKGSTGTLIAESRAKVHYKDMLL